MFWFLFHWEVEKGLESNRSQSSQSQELHGGKNMFSQPAQLGKVSGEGALVYCLTLVSQPGMNTISDLCERETSRPEHTAT